MTPEHTTPENTAPAPADAPAAPKAAEKADPREILRQLQHSSPAFRDCKPLALGIDKAVQARFPKLERKLVRSAMRLHVTSTRYLKAMEKGGQRFDLDGNADGEVSEEHRSHAAQTLKERFAAVAKRKREQEKENRERERAAQAEERKTERLQQLVGKFSKR